MSMIRPLHGMRQAIRLPSVMQVEKENLYSAFYKLTDSRSQITSYVFDVGEVPSFCSQGCTTDGSGSLQEHWSQLSQNSECQIQCMHVPIACMHSYGCSRTMPWIQFVVLVLQCVPLYPKYCWMMCSR